MSTSSYNAIPKQKILFNNQILNYELGDFFNTTNEQITRITSIPVSNLMGNVPQLEQSRKLIGKKNLTLADIYSLTPHIADNMSQSKKKNDLEPIPGFRLPSYPYEHHRAKASVFSNFRRSIDVLPKTDESINIYRHKHSSTVMSEQRPCTAASNHSKSSVRFIKRKQKFRPDETTRSVNIQSTDDLNKTVNETLVIRSIPVGIHSSKNLNKTK